MKRLFIVMLSFITATWLISCESTVPTEPNPVDTTGNNAGSNLADTTFDLAYGSDLLQQVITMSLPAGRRDTTRVVVIVHGGSWKEGDKSELTWLQQGLKQRGFATANINYRLQNNTADNYDMKLDDVESAVNKVIQSATSYTYSPTKVYIAGHSAGGHLALCMAYSRNTNNKIKAAASLAGPTDLYRAAYYNFNAFNPVLEPFLGMPLYPLTAASEARYKAASPFYQATPSAPPTIFFHGWLNFVVAQDQSAGMANRLDSLGVSQQLINYEWTGHDWWGDAAKTNDTMNKMKAWFMSH